MKNFVQPGHGMMVTVSASAVTSGDLIAATMLVLDPIMAMKAAGTLAATERVWLDGVVVGAGNA